MALAGIVWNDVTTRKAPNWISYYRRRFVVVSHFGKRRRTLSSKELVSCHCQPHIICSIALLSIFAFALSHTAQTQQSKRSRTSLKRLYSSNSIGFRTTVSQTTTKFNCQIHTNWSDAKWNSVSLKTSQASSETGFALSFLTFHKSCHLFTKIQEWECSWSLGFAV